MTIKRQITFRIPMEDWKLLTMEADRIKKPISELCLELLEPHFEKLRQNPPGRDEED